MKCLSDAIREDRERVKRELPPLLKAVNHFLDNTHILQGPGPHREARAKLAQAALDETAKYLTK